MTPEQILTEKEKHGNEQFAALGRFVQAFEQMVDGIRSGCQWMTQKPGTSPQMIMLIWHHRVMTAGPLFEIYRGMLTVYINDGTMKLPSVDSDRALEVLQDENKEYTKLISIRNELLHGTWYIGWGNPDKEDYSEFLASKTKTTSDGIKSAEMPKTAAELILLEQRCMRLERIFRWLPIFVLTQPQLGEGAPTVSQRIIKVDGKWDNPGY